MSPGWLRDVKPGELTVAWDAGNGAAGQAIRAVVQAARRVISCSTRRSTATFPSHHPDPTVPENLGAAAGQVAAEGCDLGIAFDGDGDRIGAVDGKGRILWGDQLLVLWSRDVLHDHPGATIIADVKASQVLFDEIAAAGGKPLMWKTGHSLIKTKMAEIGAPLAGEMSGHIFFADAFYGFDDALYCGLRLLEHRGQPQGEPGRHARRAAPAGQHAGAALRLPDERKFDVVEEVKARLKKAGAKLTDIDGVRVSTPDGWWLLRASNTQAVLVARCGAPTKRASSASRPT